MPVRASYQACYYSVQPVVPISKNHVTSALLAHDRGTMNMNPAKSVFVLLMVMLSLLGQTGYASAQATAITVSSQLPIALEVFVPCAAGGAGEVVSLSGTLHRLFHLTFDANGAIHAKFQDQPQRLSGIGQSTGAAYQGTGVTQDLLNTNPS